jgi:hypothetical protein
MQAATNRIRIIPYIIVIEQTVAAKDPVQQIIKKEAESLLQSMFS